MKYNISWFQFLLYAHIILEISNYNLIRKKDFHILPIIRSFTCNCLRKIYTWCTPKSFIISLYAFFLLYSLSSLFYGHNISQKVAPLHNANFDAVIKYLVIWFPFFESLMTDIFKLKENLNSWCSFFSWLIIVGKFMESCNMSLK